MKYGIEQTESEVEQLFAQEIAIILTHKVKRAIPQIEKRCSQVIVDFIQQSETYQALSDTLLRGLLGLSEAEAAQIQADILEVARNDLRVTLQRPRVTGNQISPILKIELIEKPTSDYRNIGTYTSSGGFEIKPMDWLLFQGDSIIIDDFGTRNVGGNAGKANLGVIMIPSGFFSIPSEHSGTQNRNFITKALTDKRREVTKQLEQLLLDELTK